MSRWWVIVEWLGAGWVRVDRSAVPVAGGELLLLGDGGVRRASGQFSHAGKKTELRTDGTRDLRSKAKFTAKAPRSPGFEGRGFGSKTRDRDGWDG